MLPASQRLHGALTRRPWAAPTALALLAGALLLVRLATPGRIMFDETYYVTDALDYLETGVESSFAVHPTVGKWLIAGSIALFGDTPFGWRFSGAVAGVVIVVLTHLLARRLLVGTPDGWWLALLAPVLLLADGLFVTQARIAMLDIHLAMFALAGLYVLVVDRDGRRAADPDTEAWPQRVLSLRVLAGVLFGLAIGVKWSGLLALGGAGLLTIGWELGATRGRRWRLLPGRALAVLGSLVIVPAVVYAATWIPWLVNYPDTSTAGCEDGEDEVPCEDALGERLEGLVRHHDMMADFHLDLEASHTYRSDPLGWVVLQRPVVYYWSTCSSEQATTEPTIDPDTGESAPVCEVPEGTAGEVLGIGNPALWWGFLLLTPLLVAGTVTRDRRSAVALVAWLATWLPWLAVSRTAFLFYLVPAVPVIAVGTVVALHRLGDPLPVRRTYLGAILAAALGVAVTGALLGFDIAGGVRLVAGAGAVGWALGAAAGAAADRQHAAAVSAATLEGPWTSWPPPAQPSTPGAPEDDDADAAMAPSTAGRWALGLTLVVLAVAVYFAPVWLALPLDEAAIRTRWWFDSWI